MVARRMRLLYLYKGGPVINLYIVPEAEVCVNPLFEGAGYYANGYPDKHPVLMNLIKKDTTDEHRKILVSVFMKWSVLRIQLC